MTESVSQSQGRELNMGRDSSWLIGADIIAVFLALIGQIVLTRALITEDYGIFIICLLYTSPSPRDLSTSRMPSSA